MKALLVGTGSIGARHLRNLKSLCPEAVVAVWRQQNKRAISPDLQPLVDASFSSEKEATAWRPDLAFICNPSPLHAPTGVALAQAGAALFVEKPLAPALQAGRELVEACRHAKRPLFVGYNLAFENGLRCCLETLRAGKLGRVVSVRAEVGQYLPDWRPQSDYRDGVTAQARLGGGVLLELSHEIDFALATMGGVRSVFARLAKLSDLEVDAEDTAELALEFASGALGSIHLDMVRRDPARQCTWIGTEGSLVWNGLTGAASLHLPGKAPAELNSESTPDRNAMYLAEMAHFLAGVESPIAFEESTRRAIDVLEIIEAARLSSRQELPISLPLPAGHA